MDFIFVITGDGVAFIVALISLLDLLIAFSYNLRVARYVLPMVRNRCLSCELYLAIVGEVREKTRKDIDLRKLITGLQVFAFLFVLYLLQPAEWFMPVYVLLFLGSILLVWVANNHYEIVVRVAQDLPPDEKRLLWFATHKRKDYP